MRVDWGHPPFGSKRHPEWASSQARPGEQKERLAVRSGDLSLFSGTSRCFWSGDAEDLTPFFLALLRLPGMFAFACLTPCKRRQGICSVPDAAEKQSWLGKRDFRDGVDTPTWCGISACGPSWGSAVGAHGKLELEAG